ncbi:MAG: hypothetical protein LBC56_01060 [Oscillospiraceae bacterium]|jgi:hypothetical protein|nr:hypothetical protein [Oscillospiraceae bacterium]
MKKALIIILALAVLLTVFSGCVELAYKIADKVKETEPEESSQPIFIMDGKAIFEKDRFIEAYNIAAAELGAHLIDKDKFEPDKDGSYIYESGDNILMFGSAAIWHINYGDNPAESSLDYAAIVSAVTGLSPQESKKAIIELIAQKTEPANEMYDQPYVSKIQIGELYFVFEFDSTISIAQFTVIQENKAWLYE